MWEGSTSKFSQKTLIQSIKNGGLKLCHYSSKVEALKLSWIKRLTSKSTSTWKILPQNFYNCNDLNLYFKANHDLLTKKEIPDFYLEIHKLFMKNFKNEPINLTEILNQSIWLNKHLTINHTYIHNHEWIKKGIHYVKDLVDEQCNLLNHHDLEKIYKIKSSFLITLQIHSSIPNKWKNILNNSKKKPTNKTQGNLININKKYIDIKKVTCKDLYWHLINSYKHTPTSIKKWTDIFPKFTNVDFDIWSGIFKIPFKTLRDTKVQTFQYRLLHNIIPCNQWLCNLKIKNSNICDYCNEIDDIPHFFLYCPKVNDFWKYWANWWENISTTNITNCLDISECILFGFPGNEDETQVLNYCIIYTKYYIYIQKLFNKNQLEMHACLTQIKHSLNTEQNICNSQNKKHKFKKFLNIYENL